MIISNTERAAPTRPVLRISKGDLDVVCDWDDTLAAKHLGFGDCADR